MSFLTRVSAARPAARRILATTSLRGIATTAPLRNTNSSDSSDIGVGELQGAKFKIEPLRRVGEDDNTKRARLVYQSRKRGTLESDLLLSTFAATHLPTFPRALLDQYDLFLDENDWDIYYWATQSEDLGATNPSTEDSLAREPPKGEWAQTVGTYRPAYRPVPQRWKDSEILERLREHVQRRRADGSEGKGMGFMPPLEAN